MDLTHFMEDDLMPASIPVPVRQTILRRWQNGDSVAKLAEELQLSERTVRHLVRRFSQRGEEALAPDYTRCGTKKIPVESVPFQKALGSRGFPHQEVRWASCQSDRLAPSGTCPACSSHCRRSSTGASSPGREGGGTERVG